MDTVTLCGGGNAVHVLVPVLAQAGATVNVFAPYPGEVERLRAGLAVHGAIEVLYPEPIRREQHGRRPEQHRRIEGAAGSLRGTPHRVNSDPIQVIPGAEMVLLAVPAFAHEFVLRAVAPHLDAGAWVVALPARGGFDYVARDLLGGLDVVICGLQTLPWACRIRRYGEEVEILGTKATVDVAALPADRASEVAVTLGRLFGVPLNPVPTMLALTLGNTGQLIHPGIMYGLFADWNESPIAEAPLFYQGVDGATATVLQAMSDEVQAVCRALERVRPGLDLSAVKPLGEWLARVYPQAIADRSSLRNAFVTNRVYAGLRAPMRPADGGGLVPDFGSRYLTEDVPYGLVVTRGIAELAGVSTPMMDRVIVWAQEVMGKEYLRHGRLIGRDVGETRAPQRYKSMTDGK